MSEPKPILMEVYDLECLCNYFSYTGKDTISGKIVQFEISDRRNDLQDLIKHVYTLSAMIGFNNVGYDYPLLHFLLAEATGWKKKPANVITGKLYQQSQTIIETEFSAIPEWKTLIRQVDLFKIHHFDNRAKRTSLKDVEIAIGFHRVEDMPFSHTHRVEPGEEDIILSYNLNDVEATYRFYELSIPAIKLRQQLGKQYGLSLINANDPKIGSELFGKFIAEALNIPIKELRSMRTPRQQIAFKDCILPYVSYRSKPFQTLLQKLQNTVITKTKGSLKDSVIYKGFQYDFGTGGIHGAVKSGIYEATTTRKIKSCDVTSLYPNLAIQNNFYPEHLGPAFVKIYNTVFETRAVAKKEGNKAVNEGLKLALNGVYGKSNDEHSFFYDPLFTMQITINGQLLLTMLAEQLADAGFQILMINTDGLECYVPIEQEAEYDRICEEWMQLTKLNLEFDEYEKLIIRDVNNYIGVFTSGKVKHKGTFEIEKGFHKNPSSKIVAIALSDYFTQGIPVEKTILSHDNILDFCNRFKATYGWWSEMRKVDAATGTVQVTRCQKTNRYYVSNRGSTYLKCHHDGREEQIEARWQCTLYNNHTPEIPISEYDLDYEYYIRECYKILDVIEEKQLTLF